MRGIQRGIGILEDHLHFAAHLAQRFTLEGGDFLAFKFHTARCGAVKLQNGASGGGFTAAAFTHQPQRFAFINMEADAINSFHRRDFALEDDTRLDREMFFKICYFDQNAFALRRCFGRILQSEYQA